jgi:hypothetical protein
MKAPKLPRKLKKVVCKISSEIGVGGQGDKMIKQRFGRLTWRERQRYNEDIEAMKGIRRDAFRQACIEVLGEDPETDWE